jgi:hypothetical protein
LQWKDLWGISVWCVVQFFLKKSHCKIKLLNYIVCCLWLQTFRNFQQKGSTVWLQRGSTTQWEVSLLFKTLEGWYIR